MDGLVSSLRQDLERYEQHLREIETKREHAYASLKQQVRASQHQQLGAPREAGNLVTALRGSQVRGRWGEITLRRVVELAGLTEYCDYVEQVTTDTETGRLRPDMVVPPAQRSRGDRRRESAGGRLPRRHGRHHRERPARRRCVATPSWCAST